MPKKRVNAFDQGNIIDLIFESDKKIKNQKIYKLDEAVTPKVLSFAGKKVKQAGKDIGKGILNFALFNKICRTIAEKLNKTWALKRATGNVVKEIYQKALIVLAFFYKSKYKLILIRGFSQYYSWDLALAIIFVYESLKNDKGIIDAIKNAYTVTPDIMKKQIEDYYNKITTKILSISLLSLDVIDKNAQIDKSREVGGGFGDTGIEVNKLVDYFKTRSTNLSNPMTFIRDIERYKTTKRPKTETVAYLDKLMTALNDIEGYWNSKLSGTKKDDIQKAIYNGQDEVKFPRPVDIKDDTGKNINIASVTGIVNINDNFVLSKIKDKPQINKPKIIFCLLLYDFKASPLELRTTEQIIEKIDFLKNIY